VVAAQSAISPDGNHIAFVAELPGKRPALWVRELDSPDARVLQGTEEALYPFWSPDSRFLGFFAQGKLKTVSLTGGPPATLSDAPLDSRGGTWNQEGTILFAPSSTDVIYRIASSGGPLTPVTTLDKARAENSHRFPSFLPDGRHFVYVVRSERPENWGLHIGSLDSSAVKRLTNASTESALVVPSGHLLYLRGSTLLAQSIDLRRFELEGEPAKIADSVATTATAYAAFSVSRNDTLVYASRADLKGQLRWFDRTGAQLETVGDAAGFLDFELSPDERALAVSRLDEQLNAADIWTVDLSRKVWSRLTSDRSNDASVLWSPDGTRLVFRSNRRGLTDAFQKRPSGSAPEELWFGVGTNLITSDWTSDGRFIVFTNTRAVSGFDIWAWPTAGDTEATLLVRTSLNAVHGRVSPDGRWLAYASDESGQWEVYVQPFPATGEKWHVSARGGSEPRWRRDGRELFFLGSDMVMMSVDLKNGPSDAGAAVPLFQTRVPLTGNPYRSNYTVSRDGRRFLVNTSADAGLSAPLTVILDWQALIHP
jgi:Tol biopolymer transport system component